jgi:hypothetical protein
MRKNRTSADCAKKEIMLFRMKRNDKKETCVFRNEERTDS